ncbi:MAG: hypothetical protein R2729_11825 [Bryobacteraceae bacterium]
MGRIIPKFAFLAAFVVAAQPPGRVAVGEEEIALLDAPKGRKDFSCGAGHWDPSLGFDLRYHAGWQAELPAKQLPDRSARYRVVLRVRPVGGEPLYITDSLRSPPRSRARGNKVVLWGGFVVGPGKYDVDWLLRDPQNRYCTAHWSVSVKPDDDVRLAIAPNTAAAPWSSLPPAEMTSGGLRHRVKLLVNLSNTRPGRATLDRRDLAAVAAMLRTVAREPRFAEFDIVAFNMQEERVIYEASGAKGLDFHALGEALGSLRLGVVDYKKLADRNSATRFLTTLLARHLAPPLEGSPGPECVIIVGPKIFLSKNVPKEAMAAFEGARVPVFYLNYVPRIRGMPWRDTVGNAVRAYGGNEYRITTPKELGEALAEILERLNTARASR